MINLPIKAHFDHPIGGLVLLNNFPTLSWTSLNITSATCVLVGRNVQVLLRQRPDQDKTTKIPPRKAGQQTARGIFRVLPDTLARRALRCCISWRSHELARMRNCLQPPFWRSSCSHRSQDSSPDVSRGLPCGYFCIPTIDS